MTQPLITSLLKLPRPVAPGALVPSASPPTALVGGADAVPIELSFTGLNTSLPVGVDIVFLIDNSGSMDSNDPGKKRFRAVRDLVTSFQGSRDGLDRVAVITFAGDEATVVQDWQNWSSTAVTGSAWNA